MVKHLILVTPICGDQLLSCGGDPQVVQYLIEEGGVDHSLRDSVRNNNCNCACCVTPLWLNMPPCAD